MYFLKAKKSCFIIHASLLLVFLLISLKSSIFALSSSFINSSDKNGVETVFSPEQGRSCSLDGDSCCCDVDVHNGANCCCKSKVFGMETVELAVNSSESTIFESIIGSIKCSNIPGDFQTGLLSDYELLSSNPALSILEMSDSQIYFKKRNNVEPHLFIPAKPPRTIS